LGEAELGLVDVEAGLGGDLFERLAARNASIVKCENYSRKREREREDNRKSSKKKSPK